MILLLTKFELNYKFTRTHYAEQKLELQTKVIGIIIFAFVTAVRLMFSNKLLLPRAKLLNQSVCLSVYVWRSIKYKNPAS